MNWPFGQDARQVSRPFLFRAPLSRKVSAVPILNGGAKPVAREQVRYGSNSPPFKMPDVDWKLLLARFKFYGWFLITKLALGIVYLSLVREGFRFVIPMLAMKMSKVPGFAFLDDYQMTYRLDLASPMALFVLLAVFWLWDRALGLWLIGQDTNYETDDPQFRARRELLIYSMATVMLLMDAILFYIALVQSNWGGSMFSLTALIATILYSSVLVFATLVTIDLRQKLSIVEGKSREKSV